MEQNLPRELLRQAKLQIGQYIGQLGVCDQVGRLTLVNLRGDNFAEEIGQLIGHIDGVLSANTL